MTRYIGIRHRVKKTAEGESRPTMVAIREESFLTEHELKTEQDELDFVLGRFPTTWRAAEENEDFSAFRPHHIKTRRVKGEEKTRVPSSYDGLKSGDEVAVIFGGSGDRMTFSASRIGESAGFLVFRIPPAVLNANRGDAAKDADHITLAKLLEKSPRLFYPVILKDRDFIEMTEKYRRRVAAQKDRIRCELRLRQRYIGEIFLSPGLYPEGSIEVAYDELLANDTVLQNLTAEEKRRENELRASVHKLDVWHKVLEPIPGVGEVIAAGILTPIGDIRRFRVEASPEKLAELRAEENRLKAEGKFSEDEDKVRHRITSDTPPYQILQMVRSWKRANGKEEGAKLLDAALECHKQRKLLRKKAAAKSAAKLVAYCGVHVMPDGSFVRHRRGQKQNTGSPQARQALYLLGKEQFVYQKDSEWGKRLRFYKAELRKRHPEEVVGENGKKKYTDAHIHKMAVWRTLTRFVEWLSREWNRLDKKTASPRKEMKKAA